MDKNYNPEIEEKIYKRWVEKNYFHAAADPNKKPFTIAMPPPNITGRLHMGHALNHTLQDIIIRYKRMKGYSALWLPGADHAAIATEVKIVEAMAEEGLTKADLGREKFLERAWKWKEEYGGIISKQIRKLGASCDWSRERFTLDDGLSNAVAEAFINLYNKGYIYKGEKLINWCPHCKTSLSDAEVLHEDKDSTLYYLKYPVEGTEEFLTFATTRPETILADVAVAVNPEDERYKRFVGGFVTVPIVNRRIPVIEDSYVKKDFGSGAVKITPGHDPNDFELGERHSLPVINILNDDGTINEAGGHYAGSDVFSARAKMIAEFKSLGLFVKEETIKHAVGVHERCKKIVEPVIRNQWFVKMAELAKPALCALDEELRFIPPRFSKIYSHWLNTIRDWCVSRQIWWGHRIPAYYCDKCGATFVGREAPDVCNVCSFTGFSQDPDTLDTWFSSALWPFSTLGWPEKTKDLEYFFPTDVLVTSYDIIFFWVVRMVFSSIEHMGKVPFDAVLINGLVRDKFGRKESKSLGNGVDPLEIIAEYGADALRLSLVLGNAPGNDMRFSMTKLRADRNFLNKLWNAARFVEMNMDGSEHENLTDADKWIVSKANALIKNVTENLDKYELSVALSNIYDFVWNYFCDWYIEMVKSRLYNKEDPTRGAALYALKNVLFTILKLAHPFLPFITEEIFTSLAPDAGSIMILDFPEYREENNYQTDAELAILAVREIRNIRAEKNISPGVKTDIYIEAKNKDSLRIFKESEAYFKTLGKAENIFYSAPTGSAVSAVLPGAVIYLPLDAGKESERLNAQKIKLQKELERAQNKLNNPGFAQKAPESLIEEEREKIKKFAKMLDDLETRIKQI